MEKAIKLIKFWVLTRLFIAVDVFAAASTGAPWENTATNIADSLTGPTAQAIGLIALAAVGMGISLGGAGGFVGKMIPVALGLTIVFGAGTFFLNFLGFTGALTF